MAGIEAQVVESSGVSLKKRGWTQPGTSCLTQHITIRMQTAASTASPTVRPNSSHIYSNLHNV